MKKIILCSVLCLSTFSSPILFASATTLTEWGTSASVVSGACVGDSCNPLGVFLGGINQELTAGGINELNAVTGETAINQGVAKASASVTGGSLATPILKVKASSTTDSWIGAAAFAVQGYEYTGDFSSTVLLDIFFDGNITNPDGDSATGFGVGMYLFTAAQINFSDLTDNPYAVLGALALTASSSVPISQIYELNVTTDGAVNEIGRLSIDLNPGEQFYLAGGVFAAAGGAGAIADAFSTLTVGFNSDSISVASDSVPEPSTVLLFMSALLLGGTRLKQFK